MKRFINKHRYAVGIVLAVALLFVFPLGAPFALMALAKDRTRFSVKGGGSFKIALVASGGALTSMDFLGWLKETQFDVDVTNVVFKDERGYVIQQLASEETWKFTIQLPQVGIDEINLLKDANNKFYHVYYLGPVLPNGNVQEIYIPLAKITPKVPLKFMAGERILPVEITALMPKGAVSVTPAGLNVAVDTYGTIIEGANAVGQVTTSTGTIYTAAV